MDAGTVAVGKAQARQDCHVLVMFYGYIAQMAHSIFPGDLS